MNCSELVEKLSCYNHCLNESHIQEEIENVLITKEDLDDYLDLVSSAYQRKVLLRNDDFELVLIKWSCGKSSSIHGHGDSSCSFKVLEGSICEKIFSSKQDISSYISRSAHEGDILNSAPGQVHQVQNNSDKVAITLHLYSPPIIMNDITNLDTKELRYESFN